MPRSKIRSSNKIIAHYNPHSGTLSESSRKMLYGKNPTPVLERRSLYMGSRILSTNRRFYEEQQAEAFKNKYLNDIITKRNEIESQENKSEDEIRLEVDSFNKKQISDQELELLAARFGRFQSNKENKHYKAWLKGESTFVYRGQAFPVLTEAFLMRSKSYKDIIKEKEDELHKSTIGG